MGSVGRAIRWECLELYTLSEDEEKQPGIVEGGLERSQVPIYISHALCCMGSISLVKWEMS